MPNPTYDAIVSGSGFGATVTVLRLTHVQSSDRAVGISRCSAHKF